MASFAYPGGYERYDEIEKVAYLRARNEEYLECQENEEQMSIEEKVLFMKATWLQKRLNKSSQVHSMPGCQDPFETIAHYYHPYNFHNFNQTKRIAYFDSLQKGASLRRAMSSDERTQCLRYLAASYEQHLRNKSVRSHPLYADFNNMANITCILLSSSVCIPRI